MIRVLIADDHPIVRQGLAQMLASDSQIALVGEASNGADLLKKLTSLRADVVLVDISMPGLGGLDALKEIRKDFPNMPVLVLSVHPEDLYGVRAIKAGAAGYINKSSPPGELILAIRKVHAGGKYITPSLAEIMADELDGDTDKPQHNALSNREFQVMCKLASGMTVTGIAEELSLSVKTISTYRSRIMAKMNLNNNAELARYATRHGLIE